MLGPFNRKPKCWIRITLGADGIFRWGARSVGSQTINRTTYKPDEFIASGQVQGRETAGAALNAAKAAMRGWKIQRIAWPETGPIGEPGLKGPGP